MEPMGMAGAQQIPHLKMRTAVQSEEPEGGNLVQTTISVHHVRHPSL